MTATAIDNHSTASNDLAQARLLGSTSVSCVKLDLADPEAVSDLVKAHDCAISLLPASLHIKVAESCIANQTHLVTASYESADMEQLREKAQDAGVVSNIKIRCSRHA